MFLWRKRKYQQFLVEKKSALSRAMPQEKIVCVEVLCPSQPIRVMSSEVILPNHTIPGMLSPLRGKPVFVHILSLETDTKGKNHPLWVPTGIITLSSLSLAAISIAMLLVNVKTFIIKYGIYANIFAEKMLVAFASAKATHIFSAKIPVN